MDWIGFIPSVLSAVATLAAAFAAFGSLRVGKESKRVAEQVALASHHGSASQVLYESLKSVAEELRPLEKLALDLWTSWPREIEQYDCRLAGGSNPRPLRHVLANAGEMLQRHATKDGKDYRNARWLSFSLIRSGIGRTSDEEYLRLFSKADGTYYDFEEAFGYPRLDKALSSSPAFRWAFYQLMNRVSVDSWQEIWSHAWENSGLLRNFMDQFEKMQPVLRKALESMKSEQTKLEHSVFPLNSNPILSAKYRQALSIFEFLLEIGDQDFWEWYIDGPHKDDLVPLVVSSIGIAILTNKAIGQLSYEI